MLLKNLKRFSFVVMMAFIAVLLVGCGGDNPEELLAEAKAKIMVDSSITNLASDINLQDKVTIKDSKNEEIVIDVVWTATESDYFSIVVGTDNKVVGKVTRPVPGSEQPEVTLTATLTYEKKTTERQWTIYIAPLPESEAFTIEEAIKQPVDTVVTVEGIVTYIMAKKGFFLKDETASIYIYTNGEVDAAVEPGAKVEVTGSKIKYYDLYEIENPTYEVVEAAPTSGFDYASEAVEITVKDADAKAFKDEESIPNYGVVYTITGVVEERGDYNDLYIVGPKDGKFIQFYYGADETALAEVKALVGKTIEVTALVYDHHSDGYWRILPYAGTAKEVESVELTDQEKVDRVVGELGTAYVENQEIMGDLVLVDGNAVDDALVITWESSNETILGADGKYTSPTEDTSVTLTATVTLNDAEETFEVVVLVKVGVPVVTVLEAVNSADDSIVAIEGDVTYVMPGHSFFVNDGTASINVYVNGSIPSAIQPGAKVKVVGTKDVYFNLHQIKTPTSTVVEEAPAEYDYASKAVEATIAEIDGKVFEGAESIANYGVIYKVTGVVELKGSYNDVVLTDPVSGKNLYTYHRAQSEPLDEMEALAGKTIEITGIIYDHHSDGYWRILPYTGSVKELAGVELNDEEKVMAAKVELESQFVENQDVKADLVLPLENSKYEGLTIEWASSNEAIIAVDGKFVAPAEDTSVTLTATITLNEATATFSVSVLAKMIDSTPAANIFFSEYVEGSGYNKAMEIYNNEGVDVDLEGYTIEIFSNGSTEPSSYNPPIELTGILKAGETLVLIGSNDAADPILKEKADVVSGTINHNGDDFYVLKKGDQIVDSFGQFGVDPGDGYGTDPSTKDMTWVRKSSVTTGDTIIDDVFDPTVEWVATSKDDFTGLGSHTID